MTINYERACKKDSGNGKFVAKFDIPNVPSALRDRSSGMKNDLDPKIGQQDEKLHLRGEGKRIKEGIISNIGIKQWEGISKNLSDKDICSEYKL